MIKGMNPKKLARKVVRGPVLRAAETSYRRTRGAIWQTRYGFAGRSLKIIAVTGTNGKTTTVSYIDSVLKAAGKRTAVYTTAYFEIDGRRTPNRTHMTVASQRSVQKFFAEAKKAGVDYVVLEITSNALDQKRIAGIKVEVAVMTNLTQDHLDYHGTMEQYAAAKARLFSREYQPKHSVLNIDDQWYEFFAGRAVGQQLSYGTRADATLQLTGHDASDQGSSFNFLCGDQLYAGTTKLVGLFNIYNALAALAVGQALQLRMDQVLQGVADLQVVPGRMEEIDEGQDFKVLVDFAYTPDALLNALSSLQEIAKGNVHIVFGATGDRDKSKRPLMGEVVAENADYIYLTDDETYTEDPKAIRDAVHEGIIRKSGEAKTKVFDDRLKAIRAAFKAAGAGDVVLLAGLGHEDYRNMGGRKLSWDEREVARTEIKQLTK
jgi:UDP-N-acetylmuramoyl-L-alanyl-D-glutamate--2,6-diaminopimelate ligase